MEEINGQAKKYASRAAEKLEFALNEFKVEVKGKAAADLGCSTGGFTDVLLRRGVSKVYSVDTAYGQLDWGLRNDKRVVVMERNNALYVDIPEQLDLVVVDVGWTPQKLIVPKALTLLKQNGQLISLLKPHYEAKSHNVRLIKGKVEEETVEDLVGMVIEDLKKQNIQISGCVKSPVTGSKGGNSEYLILINRYG